MSFLLCLAPAWLAQSIEYKNFLLCLTKDNIEYKNLGAIYESNKEK
jgi:hypothetical protein